MTHILSNEVGHFVSDEHRFIATMISEYHPTLSLVWVPPEQRALDEQFPYAILHTPENMPPYIVRRVTQEDMNADLIAWLYMNDGTRNPRDLNAVQDMEEATRKMVADRIAAEQNAEKADFVVSVLKGKNYFRHGGKVYS